MAFPTAVNSQITDSVTQGNLATTGAASSVALATLYQASAHSLAILFQNAVQAQQQGAVTAQAATTAGVALLYSLGGAEPEPIKGLGAA